MGLCPQPLAAACPRYLRPAATRPIRDIHQKGSRVHQQNHVIPTPHSFGNRLDRITYKDEVEATALADRDRRLKEATSSWMVYRSRGSYPALPLAVRLTQGSSWLSHAWYW